MDGILLIDKPSGWTSFDVVNRVRRLVETSTIRVTGKKRFPVGHTGTLDPLATGLLVLLLGKYTKRAVDMTKLDKTYEITMCLGITSTTADGEGEKVSVSDAVPTISEIQDVMSKFTGDIMQTPPIYSAIKVNGQRAYKLAREGKAVELAARPVHIYSISIEKYEYPLVYFTSRVSSGTYIRSLVEDAGKSLGTGAYMQALRRTQVGDFLIKDAHDTDQLSFEMIRQFIKD